MDITEAPPEQVVATLPEAVAAALPGAMVSRLAANVELAHRLAHVEKERDEALAAAHRYQTTSIRLSVENRALRERVEALTRANHARPRWFGRWSR